MLIFPFLELSPQAYRIANFVGMGSTIILGRGAAEGHAPALTSGCRCWRRFVSTGRLGRPLMHFRFPGLDRIDQFYYTSENVDKRTTSRFYGYTLEDPAARPAAARPYLEFGHFVSADRKIDYPALLPRVTTPTLMIAGESDCMSDIPSTELTLAGLSSLDKSLMRFGKRDGQVADYGHCDLVWSRYAPARSSPVDRLARPPPAGAAPVPTPSPQTITTRSSLPAPL